MNIHETIEYKGKKILVHQDEGPENPFEAWDCEPPILTYYGGRHGYAKSYCGAPETISEVVAMLPDSMFERGNRVKLIKDVLNCSFREFTEALQHEGTSVRDTFSILLSEQVGAKPEGWRSAQEWMEAAQALLSLAGIPCLYTQSNGYSQGDSALVLVVITPEWLQKSGASPDHSTEIMQGAVDLYSAWAWGDVYGYTLEDLGGDEIDGSCWGFYGPNHDKSGLLEQAQGEIDYHIEKVAKEAATLLKAFSFEGDLAE